VGPATLTRFFALHILVLPMALAGLIALHLALVVRHGIGGLSTEEESRKEGPWFYPEHLVKDAVMASLLLAAAFALAAIYGAPLEEPADPAAVGYVPRPEWYFLWLYRLLWYFKGSWELVGTLVIPTILLVLFLSLPFVDRNPLRHPRRRPLATALGSLFVAAVTFLTLSGAQAPRPPVASVQAPVVTTVRNSANSQKGKELYDGLGCASCHSIAGGGSSAGPDLTRVGGKRDAAWLVRFFHDPQSVVPGGTMPAYNLSHEQVDWLVEYLMTLK
jgi:ubiquinol-cytochrome c reductase cytochrome b subunit